MNPATPTHLAGRPEDVAEDESAVLGDVGEDLLVAAVLGAVVDVLDGVVADGSAGGVAEVLYTRPGDGQNHLRDDGLRLIHGLMW